MVNQFLRIAGRRSRKRYFSRNLPSLRKLPLRHISRIEICREADYMSASSLI
jgi:hypothetical protein